MTALYFGIVSWAESPQHALDLFWEQPWIVTPLILGFGVQVAVPVSLSAAQDLPEVPPSAMQARGLAPQSESHDFTAPAFLPEMADAVFVLPLVFILLAAGNRTAARAWARWEREHALRIRLWYGLVMVGLGAAMLMLVIR